MIPITDSNFSFFLLNIRSLCKHVKDLKTVLANNFVDIVLLTETQIVHSTGVSSIITDLPKYKINFNNSQFKYNSLAIGNKDRTFLSDIDCLAGVTKLNLKK